MSISDRTLAIEAAAAAALVVTAVALTSPADVWLTGLGLHPAWLPVIVLAARYGPRGLFTALIVSWGGLAVVDLALGGDLGGLVVRARSTTDLFALVAATLVGWVGMMHESRMARAQTRLLDATELHDQAASTVQALHDGLAYLRTRHDRVDIAVSLWRNLAGRIERGSGIDAATAALELCAIRTGARAGLVQLRDGLRLTTVAWRGQWAVGSPRPHDIAGDRTVHAAIAARQGITAGPDATEDDSQVASPIFDHAGGVIGVIALRGLAPSTLRAADLRDLQVIAQWLAPALARPLTASPHRRRAADRSL